jgi:hypothetical protein
MGWLESSAGWISGCMSREYPVMAIAAVPSDRPPAFRPHGAPPPPSWSRTETAALGETVNRRVRDVLGSCE